MTTTQVHAQPLGIAKFAPFVSRTVIRDNGAFVSVDTHTRLATEDGLGGGEEFSHTRHFGGFGVSRVDAHAAALKWVRRVNG